MVARTRCWNFNDEGKRLRPCRPNCTFVHPDSRQWETAERRKPREDTRKGSSDYPQRRDSGWAKRPSDWGSSSAGSWSGQATSTLTSSSQFFSSNREPKSPLVGSETGIPAASSKKFSIHESYVWDTGTTATDQTSAPSDSTWGGDSASAWGNTSSWGDRSEPTWGNASKSVWGSASDSSWGDQGGWNQPASSSSTSGWGSTTSSRTIVTGAWGTGESSSSTHGKGGREEASATQWQNVDQKDKGKGREYPPPPSVAHPPPPEPQASVRPSPPPPMKLSLSGEKQGATIKVPGGRFQPSKPANTQAPLDPLPKNGTDSTNPTAGPESRHGAPIPTPTNAAKKYLGPEGRVQLFRDTQRHIQEAVFYRMQYRRAKNNLLHFNQLQHSKRFEFPSADAKSQLELEFDKAKKQVNNAKERFEQELQNLLRLPSITSESESLRDPKTMEKHFLRYSFEVEKWIHDAQTQVSLVVSPVILEEEESISEPSTELDTMARLLVGKKDYTQEELKKAVDDLERRVDIIVDLHEGLAGSPEVAEYFGRLPERVASALPDISNLTLEDLEVLPASIVDQDDQRSKALNGQLDVQAERMKDTFVEIAALNDEIIQSIKETAEIDGVCDRAEQRIEEMRQENFVATARLANLTEELKHLHADELERRRLKMEAEHAAVDEQILEAIRPIVLEYIKQEFEPIFNSLRIRCDETQDELAQRIGEIVEPMVRLADDICRWILLSQQEGSSSPPIFATG